MHAAAELLPELDEEAASTRKLLALVPDARFAWKPHPKSWSVGELATHIANIPSWLALTIEGDELDLPGPGKPPWKPPHAATAGELVQQFDANVARGRSLLAAADDARLAGAWTLKKGSVELFTLARTRVLRGFVFNHLVHHRGQLTVYLRLLDVPLPMIYGPTADAPL